jgi:diguanylate cyclase (GGDEF)-like protein
MELAALGLLVQTVGAALLALIFLYLSRGGGNRILNAAGYAWTFLFLSLACYWVSLEQGWPFERLLYQYWKFLFMAALLVAAVRMNREARLGRPLAIVAVLALPASYALSRFVTSGSLFFAIHMGLLAAVWLVVAILVFRSRARGLGKLLAGLLAVVTTMVHVGYVVFFLLSAVQAERSFPFLAYTGFYDLFLEMLFGIGLIIWAMEETEARLATIHARAIDDTERSRRRAQIDPLTEAYNRFFLDEIRPTLARGESGGSIVLIDVDGLKTINDREGHEEGDKAIWTVAAAIKKLIRGDDFLIRWGGDEFLVILPGMDEDLAKKRFYMLPARIEEIRQSPRATRSYRKFIAASVGVTPYSTRVPLDIAIERADRVMYERKKAYKQMRG